MKSAAATVTRVEFDVERYQSFLYDLGDADADLSMFLFDGTPRADSWVPLPIYSASPRLRPPNIWSLSGAAVLVMSNETVSVLEPFVSIAGELLPLELTNGAELMYALNVLRDIDCLDKGMTDLEDPSMRKLTFIEHRLPESGLFKVPEYDTVDIFHVERDDDTDSFRRRVEDNGLEGVSFRTVWASDTGMVPLDLFPF